MIKTNDITLHSEVSQMLSDKITSFFFLKEDKVDFNEKQHTGYLKIFIHHYENMFYICKKKKT